MAVSSLKQMWRRDAACLGMDTSIFFPDSYKDVGPAKAVCAVCPVRAECLDWALTTREEHGVLGGASEEERRRILRKGRPKAGKGRPRQVA